jgi:D-3-phosphoglycerate dehydrogenase
MDRPVLGPDQIDLLKASAVVVNTARGNGIDEAALTSALSEGVLQGVGLDVYSSEPPESDNPIFRGTETVLTPHSASMTVECAERMAMVSAKNIIDFFHGRLDPALVVNGHVIGLGDGSQSAAPGTAAMSEAGNEPS